MAYFYSSKAEKYARYRWDYSSDAIEAIFSITGISTSSTVADLGAGTGILSRHFVGKAAKLILIDPGFEMISLAQRSMHGFPKSWCVRSPAEALPLPASSVDLITAAQAVHWFQPEPARAEIQRVLKPGGWLALIRNYDTNEAMGRAWNEVMTLQIGVRFSNSPAVSEPVPASYYYGNGNGTMRRMVFPFHFRQDWESFIGALNSASYTPEENSPDYPRFEQAAKSVFDSFAVLGWIDVHGETELIIGQPSH